MNICVDCSWCVDEGDMRYFCIEKAVFGGEKADCRSRNLDGKCQGFTRKPITKEEGQSGMEPTAEQEQARDEIAKQRISNLSRAKIALAKAKEIVIQAEEELSSFLAEFYEEPPEEGQKTYTIGEHKITVERGYNYKINRPGITGVCAAMSAGGDALFAPIKSSTSYSLDKKGLEWYRVNNPEVYRAICEHIEATPKKTAVTLK